MKRRLVAMLLLAMMTIASYSLNAFAVDKTATLTVQNANATAGKEVQVALALSQNTGICGATISVAYDEALTLTNVSAGSALSSLTMTKPGKYSANPIKIVWDGLEQDTSNGDIAVLTFTAPTEGRVYPITVSYANGDILDGDLNPVTLTIVNGAVTVVEHTHSLTEIPAKAATTTATGNKLYYQCTDCKACFKDEDAKTATTVEAETIAKLKSNTITASNKTLTVKTTGTQTVNLGATVKDKAKLTYKSDNKSITVDSKGKVTVKKGYVGKATITITAAATKNYAKTTKKVTVTVKKVKQPMVVTPTAKNYKLVDVKKKAQTLTLKVTKAQGAVTYKSSNTKYVTVSKGKVTVKKGAPKGKYTITVTAAGKGIYAKGSKTVTITVK